MKTFLFLSLALFLHDGMGQSFEEALRLFQAGRLDEAYRSADHVLSADKEPSHSTASLLLLSQIAFQRQDYRDSYDYAMTLLTRFKESRHHDVARLMVARSAFFLGRYRQCVEQLSWLQQHGTQSRPVREAQLLLEQLYARAIPYPQLAFLADTLDTSDVRLGLAQRLLDHGRSREAISVLTRIPRKDKLYQKKVQELQNRASLNDNASVKIAIIVSLSGPMSEVGRRILEGTTLSIRAANETPGTRIELVTFDDRSDIVTCIQIAQSIAAADDIALVIGPTESTMMAAAAGILEQARIPVISPTATKSGLTNIGSYVFQANTPLLDRTERLAEYATETLNYRTFAILAPSDAYGENAAGRFAKMVEKNGGRVIANERYYDNTVDFRTQLLQIRKRGLLDLIHHTSRSLSLKEIDSLYNAYYPVDPDNPRENATPLKLDAIFLPIYTEDIKYVAPQLAFYNIQATLLGEDSWFDLDELRLHQPYVKGAIIVSEYFVDPKRNDVLKFKERYRREFGRDPEKESYYGFDLGQAMANLVQSGATTSDRMYRALRGGINWKGLHNDMSIPALSGANSSVHLLQFKDGRFTRLE